MLGACQAQLSTVLGASCEPIDCALTAYSEAIGSPPRHPHGPSEHPKCPISSASGADADLSLSCVESSPFVYTPEVPACSSLPGADVQHTSLRV